MLQQERLRALGQMASGIAHDINNAISPGGALYRDPARERTQPQRRAREYLETIQRAIDDVAHTVARMREFYRTARTAAELAPVDLNRAVQQVLDLTRARWSDMPQQRGIDDRAAHGTGAGTAGRGGESEIREALTNLVFNAVDAMPEGGTLTLRAPRRSRAIGRAARVQVEVADTGVGMDEATRRRCLEPFFTTKGERGTGLGLAMVYGVAQRHNAEIDIDSAPGQGTTARLGFPICDAEDRASEPSFDDPVAPRMRILVVDDDPLLIRSLRDTLESDGHIVVTANGGQAGIDMFDRCRAPVGRRTPW